MTETESNYAQIEKEMLAIVFGVERFEQYVYGRPDRPQATREYIQEEFDQRPKALAAYAAETPEIQPGCYVQEGFRDDFSRYTKPCLWQFH